MVAGSPEKEEAAEGDATETTALERFRLPGLEGRTVPSAPRGTGRPGVPTLADHRPRLRAGVTEAESQAAASPNTR